MLENELKITNEVLPKPRTQATDQTRVDKLYRDPMANYGQTRSALVNKGKQGALMKAKNAAKKPTNGISKSVM